MKLFIDAHVFDGILQGSRTYLKELYSELIRNNPGITFYMGANNPEILKKEFGSAKNVRIVRYRARSRYLRLAVNIPYLLLKHKIDIAHYQYISPLFKLTKEIVTVHDVLFLDFPQYFPLSFRYLNKLLFRLSAKRADYLLTVSEYSRERISEHFKISKNEIHVICNGVNEAFYKSEGTLPDVKKIFGLRNYLLYVSRIEPRKNHIMLVKAYNDLELWKSGYDLLLIGSETLKTPELYDYLESLPEDAAVHIKILSESYGDELISFYRNASLFVYPSMAEGFGIPPLEAIAAGIPVICSGTTSMNDFSFLELGLFDPGSSDALKNKIEGFLSGRLSNGINAADIVRKQYSWKKSAEDFTRLIFKTNIG